MSSLQAKLGNYSVHARDVEYLNLGETQRDATIWMPAGSGPFPLIIECHGGAWTRGSRASDAGLCEAVASCGVVVAAIDVRMPPTASYPGSVIDVNHAIRFFKRHATDFRSRANRVGIMGTSTGGHLGLLATMRFDDPAYQSADRLGELSGIDARLALAILCWPVINPISRYRYLLAKKKEGYDVPAWVDVLLDGHDRYWKSEGAMIGGTPATLLEENRYSHLPCIGYFQAEEDVGHPEEDFEQFVELYRNHGGAVAVKRFSVAPPDKKASYSTTLQRLEAAERNRLFSDIAALVLEVLG